MNRELSTDPRGPQFIIWTAPTDALDAPRTRFGSTDDQTQAVHLIQEAFKSGAGHAFQTITRENDPLDPELVPESTRPRTAG